MSSKLAGLPISDPIPPMFDPYIIDKVSGVVSDSSSRSSLRMTGIIASTVTALGMNMDKAAETTINESINRSVRPRLKREAADAKYSGKPADAITRYKMYPVAKSKTSGIRSYIYVVDRSILQFTLIDSF